MAFDFDSADGLLAESELLMLIKEQLLFITSAAGKAADTRHHDIDNVACQRKHRPQHKIPVHNGWLNYETRFEGSLNAAILPRSTMKEDYHLQIKKRAAANDPVALKWIGMKRCDTGDFEEAAIAGHPQARCNLSGYGWGNERFDRAVKHLIITANLGYDGSIQRLKESYKEGKVSKEDLAGALRAHYAAIDATKSPQRGAAEKYLAKMPTALSIK
eukprot:scaffold514_cov150-Skeletonema_dohrnii-CCMP3373.AAC.1